MCGVAGFFGSSGTENLPILRRMLDSIAHRGPDDEGTWSDLEENLALGHRRLSIVDLSPAGHQPMLSDNGRYVLVFNGEIYNHPLLRKELADTGAAPAWRGHSDTETLLAAISRWGLQKALEKCIGMFALSLWDREARTLTLARDRIGEKPLYYGWQDDVFLFGSELKALKVHPAFRAEVDTDAVALLLTHNYIPAPYSIYRGIYKLLPGTFLELKLDGRLHGPSLPAPKPYWSMRQTVEVGRGHLFHGGDKEAIGALDELLLNAVRQQMAADVPLGAFLSGGVDSSVVVSLMQAQSARPIKTFTIGFREEGYDEAPHAKSVARHLGTEHTELYVSPREAMDVIPRLPIIFDEPFSDASQIPTFLVSQMTRRHVTVTLSGDAGDELFGGYSRYREAASLWRALSRLPRGIKHFTSQAIGAMSVESWDLLASPIMKMLPHRYRNVGDKAHKIAALFNYDSPIDLYRHMTMHWPSAASVVVGARKLPGYWDDADHQPTTGNLHEAMMAADTQTYLPDDILAKVDRAAMAVGLETRVPFLDHRVVEFAWRLPLSMKIRNSQGKWILRQVLYKYVPKELIERPKMGFGVPIASWLRGPLREWAEDLLDESRLRREGYLHPEPIRRKWQEHVSGKRNWHYLLWDVLMFQAWLEHSKTQQSRSPVQACAPVH